MTVFVKKPIRELCTVRREHVVPQANVEYTLYSLPAFDNSHKPELVDGKDIKSSKLAVESNIILFNKLNVKFRRVWNVHEMNDENAVCSTEFIPLKANQSILQDYLYYNLISDALTNTMDAARKGTSCSQQRIDVDALFSYEISVPPIAVQEKIVGILLNIDRKIKQNEAINHNLQQQAAAIFAEWLNTCTDYSTIGDMSHNILDYSPIANEQIRLLNSSDVTEGVFPIAPLVPNKGLKGHFKKRFKFGDILYSEIRPRNHHYGFVLFDASNYIASTRLMVIRAIENKVSPAMLYQYLLLPEVEAEFTAKTESRSGTFPQGNYADMASIQVPYSSTDSQATISETLSQIRYTIAHNQLESQRFAELRDALLPKLMSGEIDVSNIQL